MEHHSLSQRSTRGPYKELLEDIGPIPRGIYKVLEHEENSLLLQVGNKVYVSLTGDWYDKVISVSRHRGSLHCLPQSRFLDRYYELLEQQRQNPRELCLEKTITMCFIDPSVAREGH